MSGGVRDPLRTVAQRAGGRLLLAGALLLASALPAAAHKLKVFATVEAGAISGYAFFVGGGRPQGARVVFRDKAGDIATLVTDETGAFSFTPPRAEDITVIVDAGDGHSAETTISADRLMPLGTAPATIAQGAAPSASPAPTSSVPSAAPQPACDPSALATLVDTAVARQIRPLLEAQEQAQDHLRFNDIAGGIGMIVGLAGAALWASARRRPRPMPPGG